MNRQVRRRRSAFTLVEMLTVVTIIAILLTLVSSAIFNGLQKAKQTRLYVEVNGLAAALETFKAKHGAYPPTDLRVSIEGDQSDMYRFVTRAFPRYHVTPAQLQVDIKRPENGNFNIDNAPKPNLALVFWLVGFSGDPAYPFRGHSQRMAGIDLTNSFYDFDPERLMQKRYFPDFSNTFNDNNDNGVFDSGDTLKEKLAYFYYDSRSYRGLVDNDGSNDPNMVLTYKGISPYRKGPNMEHYANDKFQIISCGLDKKLGVGGSPVILGEPYSGDDADNITSFAAGKTMEDFTDR